MEPGEKDLVKRIERIGPALEGIQIAGPFDVADIARIKGIAPALIETACLHERLREAALSTA